MSTVDREYAEMMALLNASDDKGWHTPHRLPSERYTTSENEFFFTICTRQRLPFFAQNTLACAIIDALLWRRKKHHWRLHCYCLMQNHLHFIVQLPDEQRRVRNSGARGEMLEGILEQVGDFKSYTTSQIWWKMGGEDLLWMHSSYDRVIRYNDSVEQAVLYTLNNPVRKSLVESWEEYPYSAIVDEW